MDDNDSEETWSDATSRRDHADDSDLTSQESEEDTSEQDVVAFLNSLKQALEDKEFIEILQLLRNYEAERNGTQGGFISSVKTLFKTSFKAFLPAESVLTLLANKIKIRFLSDSQRFVTLLNIIKECKEKNKIITGVYTEACDVFHDRPDLLEELYEFLLNLDNSTRQNQRSKSSMAFHLFLFAVAFAMGISLGCYLTKS